jgi:hemerythrin-like domain-containing protein
VDIGIIVNQKLNLNREGENKMDLIQDLRSQHVEIGHALIELKDVLELKKQHVNIKKSLTGLNNGLNNFNNFDFIASLSELKNILVSHLDVEDKLLYPEFSKSKDLKLKKLGKNFSNEMLGISKVALGFFDKYSKMTNQMLKEDKSFKKDLVGFIKVVNKRVKLEETVLFVEYNKHLSKK